ncbi:dynamin family protein [Pseudanabaena mucicola]|uniref:dynamin family protein n=1 Tax=Pseudanabaena mucicola TaxID=71190 RepID=UPI00257658E7|nr:dynamin family protein [Pseudanabaena mucicola]
MNTGTYSSAKEKSDEMAAVLRDISLLIGQERDVSVNLETGGAVVCGLGFMSNAHSWAVRAQDIQQGIFKIIVLGEFKHGKSTLLNAMLGGRVLAAKATPCTAIVTMLVYGDSNNVSVYESGHDSPRVMSLESFTSEYQLTREDQETLNQQGYIDRFQNIDYAQINCQHSLCANGVRLIDSPGLKESSSRTKVTTRFLKQAQAIIFVLNATQIISADERQFIAETLGKGRLTNVFFVVNKINMVDEFEVDDIKKYVKLGLEDCFIDEEGHFDQNLYDRRVFYVDAKGALSARSVDPINQPQLENSGVLRLEIELEAFLASDEKISAYFESSIQSLSWIIPDVRTTVRQRKQTLEVPLLELEQKSKEVEQRLIGLESRKGILDRTLQVYISKISAIAANSLREHTGKMRQTWALDSQNLNLEEMFGFSWESITDFVKLIANNSETKKKINQILERELKAYTEIKFN